MSTRRTARRTTTSARPKPKSGGRSKAKTSRATESKAIIVLHDISAEEVLLFYYGPGHHDSEDSDDGIAETILEFGDEDIGITTLLHEKSKKSKRSIMFLDPHKSTVKLWGNMIDLAQGTALPRYTTKPCWWCRSTFKSHPIGCPIRYNPEKPNGTDRNRILQRFKEANLPLDEGTDFFETEGIFCTFPCVKTYILNELSRTKSPKYKRALTLLTLLYLKLMGKITIIPTAGTWKVLYEWGGHLTPQEYRASTGLLEYIETVNVRRPYMYSTSAYVQEKRLRV